MRYLNDWIWLRLSNRYNVTSATHSLTDVYDRWLRSVPSSLGVDLVDFYRQRVPDAESLNDAEYIYWSGGPLQDAVLWLDAQSVTTGHTTVPNLGSGGSVLNAQYGNGSTASTFPTLLEHTGENYVFMPTGPSSNFISFPNRASYDPTTQFSLTVRLGATDWTPAVAGDIVSRTDFGDPNRQWSLAVLDNGQLRLQVWPTGSAASFIIIDSNVLPLVDGRNYWIRVTFNGNNGSGSRVTTFEYANDQPTEPTSWTSGGTVTTAGTVSFTAVTAQTFLAVSANRLDGRYYRFIYRVGGTVQIDADFTQLVSGSQTTFVESSVNAATGTISRATSGRKTVVVTRPVWLFGTDDYLEVADNALLDFSASESFTVIAVVRQWATQPSFARFIEKRQAGDFAGYALVGLATTLGRQYMTIDDGPSSTDTSSGAGNTFAAGQFVTIAGVRNAAADTVQSFNNGFATGTAVTDTTTGSLENSAAFRVGAAAIGGFNDMELFAVAVWRRALTAAEIAQVVQYYGLSSVPSWAHLVLDEEGVPILDENGDVIETE